MASQVTMECPEGSRNHGLRRSSVTRPKTPLSTQMVVVGAQACLGPLASLRPKAPLSPLSVASTTAPPTPNGVLSPKTSICGLSAAEWEEQDLWLTSVDSRTSAPSCNAATRRPLTPLCPLSPVRPLSSSSALSTSRPLSPVHPRRPLQPLQPLSPPSISPKSSTQQQTSSRRSGAADRSTSPDLEAELLVDALGIERGEECRYAQAKQVPHIPCQTAQVKATFNPEEGLSVEFFRAYCKVDDLRDVTRLEIELDSSVHSIEEIGQHLPNLRELKLTSSSISSIRDFGIELHSLQVLWLSCCGLHDLGGVASCLPALRELYAPFNNVSDLSPLNGHDALEVLDLEGNAVAEKEEVGELSGCFSLRELTLSGNPVMQGALSRREVLDMLPRLEVLDDLDVGVQFCPALRMSDAEADAQVDMNRFLSGFVPQIDAAQVGQGRCPSATYFYYLSDDDEESDCDTCSIASVADASHDGSCLRQAVASGDKVEPLETRHQLLAEGLRQSYAQVQSSNMYCEEPDEVQLIIERLKRTKSTIHAFTDRALSTTWSSFDLAPRRQSATQPSTSRSTTSSARFHLDDLINTRDASSGLTRGEGSLAGGPMDLLRRNRISNEDSAGLLSSKAEMDIRELMRRHQTYTQPTKKVPQRPDVEACTQASAAWSRPPSSLRRPGSSARRVL